MRARLLVAVALLLGRAAHAAEISGTVVDDRGAPVAAAHVRLRGTTLGTATDGDGRFRLPFARAPGATLAAAKEGYLNAGVPLAKTRGPYRIVLAALPRATSGHHAESAGACARCHPAIGAEWATSAHARASSDPLFLAAYDGVDRAAPAYRRDFPQSDGNCATCHVPALAADAPFATDPRHLAGAPAGVPCQLCHQVQDARVDITGGKPGVLSLTLLRPAGREVLFGPLDDVIGRPDSYQPLFRRSQFCAPCHQGSFWNVSVYSEYQEWAASDYARRGVQCQDCHMRSAAGPPRRFALQKAGGILRDPRTLSSHAFAATDDVELMRGAVDLHAEANSDGGELRVRVSVRNAGAGHHLPTGSPLRNLVLLVEATDGRGRPLPLTAGPRVPRWAGEGAPADDNYAGLPGQGFAKVLAELAAYPADGARGRDFAPAYPTPFWRPAVLASDSRIPAGATAVSEYRFGAGDGPLRVRTRLIYRRTFRSWRMGTDTGDLELAGTETSIDNSGQRRLGREP
jgi:hypothetical protein